MLGFSLKASSKIRPEQGLLRLRKELGVKPSHIEGHRESSWVLMDYIDFVVHVFDGEKREFYRLERLWGDAPRIELPEEDETARRPGAATS